MREGDLRSVLLIKAIEESDPHGELIPIASRARATREIQRSAAPKAGAEATAQPGMQRLPTAMEQLLVLRANVLRQQLALRFPIIDDLSAVSMLPAWLGRLLVVLSAGLGFGLSALDASQRINVLALPLLGLLLWNLAVYALLGAAWLRGLHGKHRPPPWLPAMVTRTVLAHLRRLGAKAAPYNVTLAGALGRFTTQFSEAVAPLFVMRATRLFHLCAAAVGTGLIIGLYVRGIGLRYEAGWESTFLTAEQVRALVAFLYAPASAMIGVPLPDIARLEAMRWDGNQGGENAAPWIHLLAATLLMWIVIPRLGLALRSTLKTWRRARELTMQGDAVAYFRRIFAGASDLVGAGETAIVSYAYAPSTNALSTLRNALATALGGIIASKGCALVPYGEEDAFLSDIPGRVNSSTEVLVLLFSLATTPEDENHGTLIAGVRDWLTKKLVPVGLLVAIDEGPYVARLASLEPERARLDERRGVWRAFVVAHGLQPFFVNLSGDGAGHQQESAIRSALWRAGQA